ncbi:hypothetical protein QP794_04665 [Paenibacillus sp. UMB7766-LJ446]|uniref:hypothetical protein n=1 Tax=Paenibacillus sp. UMB7766-LJ446 TaxID=3046313 RepID=UPI00254EAAB3|nr:hypothetical protein [Paenibacillus sp. UMB7766-LJ446]MDK8189374.1 hypothetical protein [Paenibacillus sp. UMB7766-LJ446]
MRYLISDLERLSFQSMQHQLIIVDHNWIIRSCNTAWQQGLGQLLPKPGVSGHSSTTPETSYYLRLIEGWTLREEQAKNAKIVQELKSITAPFKDSHTYDIFVQTVHNEQRWFRLELTPLIQADPSLLSDLALIAHTDVTEQKQTERQLKKALSEVRTLRGLLPICAVCKQIKDEQDSWNSVESYLEKHTHAEFTHDICPDCIRRLYPKYSNILDKHA